MLIRSLGYVAATIAGRAEVAHGALSVWPLTLLGLATVSAGRSMAIQLPTMVALGASGGWARRLVTGRR